MKVRFNEFCKFTGMDWEAYETKTAWEDFLAQTIGTHEILAWWWADNQGRYV